MLVKWTTGRRTEGTTFPKNDRETEENPGEPEQVQSCYIIMLITYFMFM